MHMLSPLRNMANLPFHSLLLKIIAYFLSFTTIIVLSSSARTFENRTRNRHDSHHKLSFLMRDVLDLTLHSSFKSPTTKATSQLPFSKPLGFFPPHGGILIPETYTTTTTSPDTGFSGQTHDLSTIGISFPARAALQELEYGTVKGINEELFGTSRHKSRVVVGRIEGLYVENSEDNGGHMIALTVYFGIKGKTNDGLRLFGVYPSDHVKEESHVAIIGGIGKYLGANGYATLKKSVRTKFRGNYNKFIEFHVYLSK